MTVLVSGTVAVLVAAAGPADAQSSPQPRKADLRAQVTQRSSAPAASHPATRMVRALRHGTSGEPARAKVAATPPTTQPTGVTVSGDSATITFTASSDATSVSFGVDAPGTLAPVPVSAMQATASWDSWGYRNGSHTLYAADCGPDGACGTPVTVDFSLANAAPAITAPPAGAAVTGGFVIKAAAPGGGVRFLIDGRVRGFDSTAPYSLNYTGSALSEGRHHLQVIECSTDGKPCSGPASPVRTITSRALHPSITSITPSTFSPNGDHFKDKTRIEFKLADAETVSIAIYTSGGVHVRTTSLGQLRAGTHVWHWSGKNRSGHRVADGLYTLRLNTSRVVRGVTVRGLVTRHVRVDTTAPRVTSIAGRGAVFYPVHDGYRDHFQASGHLNEPGTLTLTVRNAAGHVVFNHGGHKRAGRVASTWSGRNHSGHVLPAGRYNWRFTVRDRAGNRRHVGYFHVYLSKKHLVAHSTRLTKNGAGFHAAGGTDACAAASTTYSNYHHGLELINTCDPYYDDVQVAIGIYKFKLPSAARYARLGAKVRGSSFYTPAEIEGGFYRTDNDDVTIQRLVTVTSGDTRTYGLGRVTANRHVNSNHVVTLGVAVDDLADAGVSDFDVETVQLHVTYYRLEN